MLQALCAELAILGLPELGRGGDGLVQEQGTGCRSFPGATGPARFLLPSLAWGHLPSLHQGVLPGAKGSCAGRLLRSEPESVSTVGHRKPDHFSCRVLVLSASSLEAGDFDLTPRRPELGLIPDPLAHLIVSFYAAWSKPHHPSHPNSGPEAPASLLPSSCVTLPKPALLQVKSTDRGRLASPDHALLTS